MPDQFDTLIKDLERVRASGSSFGVFGEGSHNYELNPPLSAVELAEFENGHGFRLPSDYRQFLLRVGNGGAGPYYGLFRLGEMDDGFDFGPWGDFVGLLSAPFPHAQAWHDLTGKPDDEAAANEHKYDELIEAFERQYFDNCHVQGAIPICHLGCALRQCL